MAKDKTGSGIGEFETFLTKLTSVKSTEDFEVSANLANAVKREDRETTFTGHLSSVKDTTDYVSSETFKVHTEKATENGTISGSLTTVSNNEELSAWDYSNTSKLVNRITAENSNLDINSEEYAELSNGEKAWKLYKEFTISDNAAAIQEWIASGTYTNIKSEDYNYTQKSKKEIIDQVTGEKVTQTTETTKINQYLTKDIDLSLSSNAQSMKAVSTGTGIANSINNLFGSNIGSEDLSKSTTVSYENYLTSLSARVDATDNNQSWGDFFGEVFSKDTLNEIAGVAIDLGVEVGTQLFKSLLPSVVSTRDSNAFENFKEEANSNKLKSYNDFKEEANSKLKSSNVFKEEANSNKYDTLARNLELNILGLLDLQEDKKLKTVDVSKMFKQFVSKNPLISQYQYNLSIPSPIIKQALKLEIDSNLFQELEFRIKGITIPEIKRTTDDFIYGHSSMSVVSDLQASVEHKADLDIICDRNFDILEYLVRLSGLGVRELQNEDCRIYNLSTVSSDSYDSETGNITAILKVLSGRELAKEAYMENKEYEFGKSDPFPQLKLSEAGVEKVKTASPVIYSKLPVFELSNFKIVNLSYPFKFESSASAKLLEIKATVTWNKMTVKWEKLYQNPTASDPKDLYYAKVKDL